jgi:hypothetical protein
MICLHADYFTQPRAHVVTSLIIVNENESVGKRKSEKISTTLNGDCVELMKK